MNAMKRSPLHEAATDGDAAAVQAALTQGVDVNSTDDAGNTALFLAATSQNISALTALLDAGADTEIANTHGNTPLWPAIFFSKGDQAAARALLDRGADPDHVNLAGNSPRSLASKIANFDLGPLF